MKVKVLQEFRDKFDHKTMYVVGKEYDFDDEERVQDLINRGLVELVEIKEEKIEVAEDAIIDNSEVKEDETAEVIADEVEFLEAPVQEAPVAEETPAAEEVKEDETVADVEEEIPEKTSGKGKKKK